MFICFSIFYYFSELTRCIGFNMFVGWKLLIITFTASFFFLLRFKLLFPNSCCAIPFPFSCKFFSQILCVSWHSTRTTEQDFAHKLRVRRKLTLCWPNSPDCPPHAGKRTKLSQPWILNRHLPHVCSLIPWRIAALVLSETQIPWESDIHPGTECALRCRCWGQCNTFLSLSRRCCPCWWQIFGLYKWLNRKAVNSLLAWQTENKCVDYSFCRSWFVPMLGD